jgi:opacity protein-like surface antigen
MRGIILAAAVVSAVVLPASGARADDEVTNVPADRYVLSARADFGQVHSHESDFGAIGGSLGLHIPIGELPLGVHVGTALVTGYGHLASTTDLGLRYYLPMSGDDPGKSLQPYVRAMASLSLVSWDIQDTTTTFGGGLGLGIQAWAWDAIGFDFEFSYRVMGGAELRQVLVGSVGLVFGM